MPDVPFVTWMVGALLFLSGIWMIWWGQRIWRHPERLGPGTTMYRYFQTDWRTGPRSATSRRQGLTVKRIKYYGARVVLGGVLSLVIGVVIIVT